MNNQSPKQDYYTTTTNTVLPLLRTTEGASMTLVRNGISVAQVSESTVKSSQTSKKQRRSRADKQTDGAQRFKSRVYRELSWSVGESVSSTCVSCHQQTQHGRRSSQQQQQLKNVKTSSGLQWRTPDFIWGGL